jgi:hypothetical protein
MYFILYPPTTTGFDITAITAAMLLADSERVRRGNVAANITATLPQTLPQMRKKREEGSFLEVQKSGSPEDRSPEDRSPEDRSPEVQKTEVQKSGSLVITISSSRSIGIPVDEAASVVAGLVQATNCRAFAITMVSHRDSYGMTVR